MTRENLARVKLCANELLYGMMWADTPQGYKYWNEVHNNLLGLIAPAKKRVVKKAKKVVKRKKH